MAKLRFCVVILLAWSFRLCHAVENTDGLSRIVIPLDKPSSTVITARSQVDETMASIKPKQNGTASFVTKDKHYVLYGSLFKDGDNYALIEVTAPMLPPNSYNTSGFVAFARWTKGHWELEELLDIGTVWRPKGWVRPKPGEYTISDDWLQIEHPADQPFYLKTLDDSGIPDVVVAGEVDKYYQSFYILRFDPKTKSLIDVDDAMAMPEYLDGFVQLYYDSGRRSEWEEYDICKWEGFKLVKIAAWHDEVPYNHPDQPFEEVSGLDENGKLITYHIEETRMSDDELTDTYKIDDETTVKFILNKHPKTPTPDTSNEETYFFTRLTKLPEKFFSFTPDEETSVNALTIKNVIVTGDPKLVKLLSFKH